MLPLSLFADPTFSAAVAFGVFANLTYYGMVFVLSLYLQRVLGHTPLQTGLAFLPLTGGFLLSNLASGPVVARFGSRVPMIAGALLDAAGFAALIFVGPSTPTAALLLPFLLIPAGMGLAVPAMTTAVLGAVAQERAGTASAVLNTARQAAGAIGVAAFGALAAHGGGATETAHIVAGVQVVGGDFGGVAGLRRADRAVCAQRGAGGGAGRWAWTGVGAARMNGTVAGERRV